MKDIVRKRKLLLWQKLNGVIDQETYNAEIQNLEDGQLTPSLTPALEESAESQD